MPRLNGKSSQGSKPITSLSRTFSCTPHCWPQKQQCVFTRRSGSALVDRRMPAITERCGPNRSMIFSGSAGIVATMSPGRGGGGVAQALAPCPGLGETKQRPAATRADLLIVLGALVHLVRETQLPLDDHQIAHHHRRGVRLPAAAAGRLLAPLSGVLVEGHADLRRP